MKVSIAIATYNGERFILEQLKSLASQTWQPDEIIIQDDGSTDQTISIIRNFSKNLSFPVSIEVNPEQLGVTKNFERAMMRCSGDVVFLSDQDDIWKNEKIEQMMDIFIKNEDILIAISDALLFTDSILRAKISLLDNIRSRHSSDADFVHGCCTAIRKDFLDLVLPIPLLESNKIGYDEYLHLIGRWSNGRAVLDKPLQYYRRHESNASQSNVYNKSIKLLSKFSYYYQQFFKISSNKKFSTWLELQKNLSIIITNRLSKETKEKRLTRLNRRSLQRTAHTLKARSTLRNYPLLFRLLSIIKLISNGEYNRFSGLKSAISDLIAK